MASSSHTSTAAANRPRLGVPTASSSSSSSSSSHGAHHTLQRYREILVARSDGVGYSTQQINSASRSTQPVGDPLPDTHDYARSWAVKLGKAIKYNLGSSSSSGSGSTTDSNNYLVRLPQGYSLHIRPHKGGKGGERDGPYVFGHPLGPIAAFRSPAELALHVLWLMSESPSRADCSCRLCVRMVSESMVPAAAATAPTVAAPVPTGPTSAVSAVSAAPAVLTATTTVTTPAAAPAASPAVPLSAPNPPPVGGSPDLFRPWELVWYQQPQKNAWRLGIVLQLLGPAAIRIAPLGVPGVTGLQVPELTLGPDVLRPFLSFSVPDMRDGFQGRPFHAIDWPQLVRESASPAQGQTPRYDMGTISLEASKAAANQINACYSMFGARPKASPTQCIYGGVFLGAEQIVVGDALRVDGEGGGADTTDIMRVSLILTDHEHLRFIGDVYRLAVTSAATPAPTPPEGALFAEELQDRNQILATVNAEQRWCWQLKEHNGHRAEAQVHGRFYVSMRLAANLRNGVFLTEAAAGRVGDDMIKALNRRQQVSGFQYQGRRESRAATIGGAIGVALPGIGEVVEE